MLRTITITFEDNLTTDGPPIRIGISPPVQGLSDLATVLLMVAKANLEIVNSTVTALDTVDEIEADRRLRPKRSGGS